MSTLIGRIPIAICMPVYNESEGIGEFLLELNEAFKAFKVFFYIVDDCSSDDTSQILRKMQDKIQMEIIQNHENLGHGPSTLKALRMAKIDNDGYVLSVDGDGQFLAKDILRLVENTIQRGAQVGIGLRIRENDPYFRVVLTFITRILIFMKTFKFPKDANTPLRLYRPQILSELIKELSCETPVPNLFILKSIYKNKLSVHTEKVLFLARRGSSKTGTSWGESVRFFPQKRLIQFSWNSFIYWIRN